MLALFLNLQEVRQDASFESSHDMDYVLAHYMLSDLKLVFLKMLLNYKHHSLLGSFFQLESLKKYCA